MKANELRIGNLVLVSDQIVSIIEVSSLDIDDETIMFELRVNDSDCAFLGNVNPIPLTEEWLLKFGFKDSQIELSYQDKLLIISAIVSGKYYFYLEDSDGSTFCLNYIEYVHQLQNLYFALTGNELTIK